MIISSVDTWHEHTGVVTIYTESVEVQTSL